MKQFGSGGAVAAALATLAGAALAFALPADAVPAVQAASSVNSVQIIGFGYDDFHGKYEASVLVNCTTAVTNGHVSVGASDGQHSVWGIGSVNCSSNTVVVELTPTPTFWTLNGWVTVSASVTGSNLKDLGSDTAYYWL